MSGAASRSAARAVGESVRRVEDRSLLTGLGCYVADVELPAMAHLAIVRADLPHARLGGVDVSEARISRSGSM